MSKMNILHCEEISTIEPAIIPEIKETRKSEYLRSLEGPSGRKLLDMMQYLKTETTAYDDLDAAIAALNEISRRNMENLNELNREIQKYTEKPKKIAESTKNRPYKRIMF